MNIHDDLDDLLGELPTDIKHRAPSAAAADAALSGSAADYADKLLMKPAKPERPPKDKVAKPPRELKGVPVSFTTSKGVDVKGLGVLYYVVRSGGKLHYKEASQVTILGDALENDALQSDVEIEDIEVPLPPKKDPDAE